ncbi:hypothetical protein BCH_02219 [Brucella sp. 191011898]|nr:hypothetical protein BCH_02219 [Brucella sp. 191011898]
MNHAFHHRLPICGAKRRSCLDIFGARTFRLRLFGARGITKDGNGFLKLAAPRCIRRSLVQKGLQAISGTIRMAILHFALRKIILRTNVIGAEFGCFLEQLLGLGRNRAAGSSRQSLTQSKNSRKVFASDPDGCAIGADRVGSPPKPQIDRRQHIPTPHITRILCQMRFSTRNEVGDGTAVRCGCKPWRERHGGHVRRTEQRIDAPGDQRHGQNCNKRQHTAGTALPAISRCGHGSLFGIEDAAGDFDARLFSTLQIDHPARNVGLNFAKLVAIDLKVIFFGGQSGLPAPRQRQQDSQRGCEG